MVSGKPADFHVDTRAAGEAPLDVTVMDANYQPVKLDAKDNKNGTYDFSYKPTRGNKHTVQVRKDCVFLLFKDVHFVIFLVIKKNSSVLKLISL